MVSAAGLIEMILFHPCELYWPENQVLCDEGRQRDYLAVSGKGERGNLDRWQKIGAGVGMGQVASENLAGVTQTALLCHLGQAYL